MNASGERDLLFGDPGILGVVLRPLPRVLSQRVHAALDADARLHLVAMAGADRKGLFVELGRVVARLREAPDAASFFPGEGRVLGWLNPAVHLVAYRAFPRAPFLGLGAGTISVVLLGKPSRDAGERPAVRSRECWFDLEDRTPDPPRELDALTPDEQLFFEDLARDFRACS